MEEDLSELLAILSFCKRDKRDRRGEREIERANAICRRNAVDTTRVRPHHCTTAHFPRRGRSLSTEMILCVNTSNYNEKYFTWSAKY